MKRVALICAGGSNNLFFVVVTESPGFVCLIRVAAVCAGPKSVSAACAGCRNLCFNIGMTLCIYIIRDISLAALCALIYRVAL